MHTASTTWSCGVFVFFFFSSRRRHTRCSRDWSSDVCSSDLGGLTLNPTPVWSPDGCQIAFRSVLETPGGPSGRISIINADGTGLRQVTPEPGPLDFAFDEGPTWSPEGHDWRSRETPCCTSSTSMER